MWLIYARKICLLVQVKKVFAASGNRLVQLFNPLANYCEMFTDNPDSLAGRFRRFGAHKKHLQLPAKKSGYKYLYRTSLCRT